MIKKEQTSERRLLIVDDDRDFVESLHEILEPRSYKLSVAYSVKGARETIRDLEPKVALLDQKLIDGLGTEIMSDLKRENHDCICIMITAYADVDSAVAAIEKGASHYLRKPVGPAELFRTLDSAFETVRLREEKRQAKEALKESESKLKEAQQIAHMGHWELDLISNTLYWSEEIYRIFDLEPQKFGASYEAFLDTVHPGDREFVDKAYTDSVKKKTTCDIVHRLLMKDGMVKHVNVRCKTEYDENGNPLRSLGTVQDITGKKKIEEELLENRKLESLGVLAGGIAHDFNNLLTAILGNINLAKTFGDISKKGYERLTEAENASLRAQDLTRQLLTFSRGGAPIKKIISIGSLIRETASFALTGSNVRCEYDIPDDLRPVEVDGGQISQVINNLIINADHAMPEGGIITVQSEHVTIGESNILPLKEGGYVRVSIEDRGTGIPEEHLTRIFDPYFTTKQKGSGLGLASAYSIIKRHDGFINVESEMGKGTTFYIYLPVSEKEIVSDKFTEEMPVTGRGKILVMDDEEVVRDVAGEMLMELGYEVEFARDGAEAIELYKKAKKSEQPFDAVIMDLTVPGGIGGKVAIKKMREIDPEVKAIVSSGYSSDTIMSDYRNYGFSGVVIKPYRIRELSKAVHKVIMGAIK